MATALPCQKENPTNPAERSCIRTSSYDETKNTPDCFYVRDMPFQVRLQPIRPAVPDLCLPMQTQVHRPEAFPNSQARYIPLSIGQRALRSIDLDPIDQPANALQIDPGRDKPDSSFEAVDKASFYSRSDLL